MVELAAIGSDQFVTGFQLAGIKQTVISEDKPAGQVRGLMGSEAGIVIIDENTVSELDEYTKEDMESSVKPVFIVVSEKAEDEGLRKMIIKSIGVDLWEK